MVRLLVLVLLLFCSQTLLAQKTKLITYDPCNGDNYPTPSGTQKELYDWLENNKKPVDVSKTRRKMVHVAFSIDAEGNIKDAKVFNPLNPAADKEALRLIRNMPKWKWTKPLDPIQDCYTILPIKFE